MYKNRIVVFNPSTKTFFLEDKKINFENHKSIAESNLIFDVTYSKYKNEFRYTKCNLESNISYVFFGCSFMFGWGLHDNETIPYYFSELTGFKYNVINCACKGRSSNTVLNILNCDILDKFKNENSKVKLVFYEIMSHSAKRNFQYIGNMDWLYINGSFREPEQPYNFIFKYFSKSYIFTTLFLEPLNKLNKEYHDNYLIKSLYKIDEIVKEKYNANLIILVYERALNTEKLKNLNVIDIKNFDVIDEKYDGHPSAKSNKVIANKIIEYINSNRLN